MVKADWITKEIISVTPVVFPIYKLILKWCPLSGSKLFTFRIDPLRQNGFYSAISLESVSILL